MANPSKQSAIWSDSQGLPMGADRVSNIPTYDITWTANEPTAASTITIADGDVPTVAELGQVTADLTAKLNLILAALESHGFVADS